MTILLTVWPFIKGSRAAQIWLAAITILIAFGLWLHFHDNAVRKADRAALEKKATEQAAKAANAADEAQIERTETINETVADVRNAATDDEWFDRMRRRQNNPPASK